MTPREALDNELNILMDASYGHITLVGEMTKDLIL